jgi:hypothetical protein
VLHLNTDMCALVMQKDLEYWQIDELILGDLYLYYSSPFRPKTFQPNLYYEILNTFLSQNKSIRVLWTVILILRHFKDVCTYMYIGLNCILKFDLITLCP